VIQPKTKSQLEALSDLSDNLMYYGCWGSGKTFILAAKTLLMSMIPNNRLALIRRKRTHLKATTWDVLIKDVLPPSWIDYYNSTELLIKLKNKSEIRGFGLDSGNDINALASQQFGFIGVEEARETREDQYDEQIGRSLRWPHIPPKFLQVMLVTNPDRPGHFLNQRFNVERWEDYKSIKAQILDNLLPKAYLRRIEQLRGVFRKRYKDGLWVGAEGMVYPFDPAVHVIKRFAIPKEWERVVSADLGYDNPLCIQWWAISPEARWYLYREIYKTHVSPSVYIPQIQSFNNADGINPRVICDHDPAIASLFKSYGVKTQNAIKDRMAGQITVNDLFEMDKSYIFEDCLVEVDNRLVEQRKPWSTAQEYPGYTWLDGKDDMSHEDDHGMDAERYAKHTRLSPKKRRKGRVAA
jgi:phage terminase large subunit